MPFESISQFETVAEAKYLSLDSRVVHLGDGAIYGICADIVAMEMEYLFSSEGLRDLRGVGVDQVDRAAVPRFASTHAADDSHALIGVMNVLGEYFGTVGLWDFEREEALGGGEVGEEREVWDV